MLETKQPRDALWLTRDQIGKRLIEKITLTPLQKDPFDHIYLECLFEPEQYQLILDAIPDRSFFHMLRHPDAMRADGTSTRFRLYLYPETLDRLPKEVRDIWTELAYALLSPKLQDAIKQKFQVALEERFSRSASSLTFYPVPILVHDEAGYKIDKHTDIQEKAITCQFYLARDAQNKHLGTLLHGVPDTKIKMMKYLPASGYAFAVKQQQSWHSVAPTDGANCGRFSVMLTYYVQSNAWFWWKCRRQRLRNYFGIPDSR